MFEISKTEAITRISPLPFTLVTSIGPNGYVNAAGVSWTTILSWEPFLIGISVAQPRYTHSCIEFCKEFVVCYPGEELAKQAWLCSTVSGRKKDKLKEFKISTVPSLKVKPPSIEKSIVSFECMLEGKTTIGDHTLFIGKVVAITSNRMVKRHLFCVNYGKLVSCNKDGETNFELEFI